MLLWDLHCCLQDLFIVAYGISVPWPGIKPTSPELQGRFLTNGWPGKSLIVLYLIFWGSPTVFHSGYSNLHPHQQCTRVPFSQYPCQFMLSVIFNKSDSDSCEVNISLCFWSAFPFRLVMLSIFSCACWPSVCLPWKNVYSDPLPIFS